MAGVPEVQIESVAAECCHPVLGRDDFGSYIRRQEFNLS
jgi:hypothetical protein